MIQGEFNVHTAVLEAYAGESATGEQFGAPVLVPCYAEATRQLVRDQNGQEAVSEARLFTDLTVAFPPGSRVTVIGRTCRVIAVAIFDDGGLTGLGHQEVSLS